VTTNGVKLMTRFIAHFDTEGDYTLQFTITHTLVSTVTSSLPLLGSGFKRRTFPSSVFPNCPRPQLPASKSNSSQQLNPSGYLTHLLIQITDLQYLGTESVENTSPLLSCSCCRGNMLVCEAVTYQWLLYSCLFLCRCLATCLHATMFSYK
jgi:hypothetical protein